MCTCHFQRLIHINVTAAVIKLFPTKEIANPRKVRNLVHGIQCKHLLAHCRYMIRI